MAPGQSQLVHYTMTHLELQADVFCILCPHVKGMTWMSMRPAGQRKTFGWGDGTHHINNVVDRPLGLASLIQQRLSDVLVDSAVTELGHLHSNQSFSLTIAQSIPQH